jgi:hypothetical protein
VGLTEDGGVAQAASGGGGVILKELSVAFLKILDGAVLGFRLASILL